MSVDAGGFIPFLEQDNLDLLNAQTQQAVSIIDQDLSQLLRLPPQRFWHVILSDDSLHTCLDSFLRFRRRCYDQSPENIQGSSDVLLQLSQRVFKVYWRMAHPREQPSLSVAAAAGSSTAGLQQSQTGVPSDPEVADLLYSRWLIDVSKMMDLAVLYSPGNSKLVGQLLHQYLKLQPRYAQDIAALSPRLTANLHELLSSVSQLGRDVLAPSLAVHSASNQLVLELADAASFFIDAGLTLQAFVGCLPEAAALLLLPEHQGELLIVLAAVYTSTVPLLHRLALQPAAADVSGLSPARISLLQQCIEGAVYQLLRAAFCTPEGAQQAAAHTAASQQWPSSSSKAAKSTLKQPPGFQHSSSSKALTAVGLNPETHGQELMNLLMLLSHPSDGLIHAAGEVPQYNLLAAMNRSHHLDREVAAAVAQGFLSLDDAQFDYFLALVDGDRQLLQQHQQQHSSSLPTGTAATTSEQASSSSSSTAQPGAAELLSMVSAVRDLLPDYGDGFITAALHANKYDTEQTINCLLEGSLPPALQHLDPALKTWSPPAAAATSSTGPSALSWTGLAHDAAAAAAAGPVAAQVQLPSLAAAAVAAPRPEVDRRTSRVLGAASSRVRSVIKNFAQEMQFEYDDEYDDSFDDLMGPGNDGVCDIEGEDTGTAAAGNGRAAADAYADEPSSHGVAGTSRRVQQQKGGQQQRKEKLWVLDGKVYNYRKDGATEVQGQAGAQAALKAAQQSALEIHGLGPGGNVPLPEQQQQKKQAATASTGAGATGSGAGAAGSGPQGVPSSLGGRGVAVTGSTDGCGAGGGRGDGDGRAAGGRGRGRGSSSSHGRKEQNKAAYGNHHRRDRALQKQSKGML